MIARLMRTIFTAEVIGWILVVSALEAFTEGISASLRNTDTRDFFWICFLAALVAFLLGRRNLRGLQAAVVITALGILGVWIVAARLFFPLLALGDAVMELFPQLIQAIRFQLSIDVTAAREAWRAVAEASGALSARLQVWLGGMLDRNVIVNDALVRNMVWMLLLWLLSAWLGWFTARRNAIAALVPSILLLSAITSYSERRVETLWVLVIILLLLMGLWNYRNHTALWERKKIDYSDSIRFDISQAVLLLSLAVGILAFVTPSFSWRELRELLRRRDGNEVADMLGVQRQPVAVQEAPGQKPSLPRDHLLTGGFANSEEIVMIIRTGELPPVPSRALVQSAPRHYWRSVTYDTYVGTGWVTSRILPQDIQPDTPLIPGLLRGYETLELNVDMLKPEGRLFWSGILFSADIPFRADWRTRPQSSLFADQSSLLRADLFAAVSPARNYRAQSYVPATTVDELRAASAKYPEELAQYLELPGAVPDRLRQLAIEITGDKTNAYDKAKAIESYLRAYPYDLEVPVPPADKDVVDYFLFELKRGYCDYYASAMVVLARLSGLPARFVSGYAPGSYDAPNAQYVVQEMHAHSWAEVYFPEIGWIEFEPTASQPEIELPVAEDRVATPTADSSAAQLLYRFRLETAISWFSPFALVLLSFVLYFTLLERWLYLRLKPETAIEKIYRRLYRLGRPLAGEPTRAETAYEFMQKLTNRVVEIKMCSHFQRTFVRAADDIQLLTALYQDTLFSDNSFHRTDVSEALHTWRHLRWRLLIARLLVIVWRVFALKQSHSAAQKRSSGA